MYKLFQENLKWIILGITIVWIITSMGSCVIETNISKTKAEIETTKAFTEKGYVQKQMKGYTKKVWTKPSEDVIIKED